MYSMTLTTPTPNKVVKALRAARVEYLLGRTVEAGQLRGAQVPGVAQDIYDMAKRKVGYQHIANQIQISRATVVRVISDPEKYGVKGPPIRKTR
jgi:DNA invertase Pin-like site-specific DNA recombinase